MCHTLLLQIKSRRSKLLIRSSGELCQLDIAGRVIYHEGSIHTMYRNLPTRDIKEDLLTVTVYKNLHLGS